MNNNDENNQNMPYLSNTSTLSAMPTNFRQSQYSYSHLNNGDENITQNNCSCPKNVTDGSCILPQSKRGDLMLILNGPQPHSLIPIHNVPAQIELINRAPVSMVLLIKSDTNGLQNNQLPWTSISLLTRSDDERPPVSFSHVIVGNERQERLSEYYDSSISSSNSQSSPYISSGFSDEGSSQNHTVDPFLIWEDQNARHGIPDEHSNSHSDVVASSSTERPSVQAIEFVDNILNVPSNSTVDPKTPSELQSEQLLSDPCPPEAPKKKRKVSSMTEEDRLACTQAERMDFTVQFQREDEEEPQQMIQSVPFPCLFAFDDHQN